MKWRTNVTLILLFVTMVAGAQSTSEGQSHAQETQLRGYWIDPSTGLMWAGKDNGKNVNWHQAVKYCRNLRLAGYSGWRLAKIGELEGIYDKSANSPGLDGPGKGRPSTWHIKGNLFLTGDQWSSTRPNDSNGHPGGYAWRFDFNQGRPIYDSELGFYTFKRALCVRSSGDK